MNEGPDKFGIRKVNALTAVADAIERDQVKPGSFAPGVERWKDEPESLTTREWIAKLIRELTYRELKEIGDELSKTKADWVGKPGEHIMETFDMAQTLDDWAHMVKDESEERVGSDDLINMA